MKDGFERQKLKIVDQNAWTGMKHEWVWKVALNAKAKEKMVMTVDVDMRVRLRASHREWLTALNA